VAKSARCGRARSARQRMRGRVSGLVQLPGEPASHLLPREASARPTAGRDGLPGGMPVPSEPAPRRPPGGAPAPPIHGDPAATVTEDEPPEDGGAEHGRTICRLAEASAKADDPESALRSLAELQREVDAFIRLQVAHGLAAGRSFGQLARALGVSRQAAHSRFRDLAPRRTSGRLMATEQTRQLVRLAYAQTCASGLEAPGSRQVLLGILRTDSGAARALKAEGITLVNALACEPANHTPADAGSLRRILRRAGRIALGRGQYMRPEEVLLAALADADGGASGTLAALGVAPASIRARLDGSDRVKSR
jgi:hypothetical protein